MTDTNDNVGILFHLPRIEIIALVSKCLNVPISSILVSDDGAVKVNDEWLTKKDYDILNQYIVDIKASAAPVINSPIFIHGAEFSNGRIIVERSDNGITIDFDGMLAPEEYRRWIASEYERLGI